ncbi:MAG TPA: serine protease, partial [Phenylobacterium sp.]|nr:serine protease [Phenylobacterium sp.]
RRAHVDAPAAPPPAPAAEGAALGPASPFDPAVVVEVSGKTEPGAGTAFSIAASGTWVTARHVVEGCSRAAIVVAPGRGVAAQVTINPEAETAILTTDGGAPPLPLGLTAGLRRGEQAFHMGFPQGRPGEASSRLIGRENLVVQGRGARTEPVLVWAETGRTDGLKGTLGGLSGAPALDDRGRVVGVTIAEAPRRGRIYTTSPETTARTLAAGGRPLVAAPGGAISPDNYGRVADDLRRNLRVAQVVCLTT